MQYNLVSMFTTIVFTKLKRNIGLLSTSFNLVAKVQYITTDLHPVYICCHRSCHNCQPTRPLGVNNPELMQKWASPTIIGGVAEVHRVCIYCGQPGHFIAFCQEARHPVKLEILVGGLLQTALYSLTLPATLCYNYDSITSASLSCS